MKLEEKSEHSPKYIFWTGGFDSTFRLLQLVNENTSQKIQPIYFRYNIDNINENAKIGMRRSQDVEIQTMDKIRGLLKSDKILPTIIIDKEEKYFLKTYLSMLWLRYKKIVRRAKCQIGSLAQYSVENNLNIEIGIIETDYMRTKLFPYLDKINDTYKINLQKTKTNFALKIFKNLEFPIIDYSKSDIFEESQKMGWLEILKQTWSCWYPQKNGTPCLRCPMCKNRII